MTNTVSESKKRLYASLLALGAGILLFRTILMLSQGALKLLVFWVSLLLIAEMLIDLCCFIASVVWWIKPLRRNASLALRLGTAAALLHALRVLVFVIGRAGPLTNFDVKPEQLEFHANTWNWNGVYLASILSALGVAGVIIIWRLRRRALRSQGSETSEK